VVFRVQMLGANMVLVNYTVLTSTKYQKIILDLLDSGKEEDVETR